MVHSICSSPTIVKKKIPLVTEQLHVTQLSSATMPGVADMPAQVPIQHHFSMSSKLAALHFKSSFTEGFSNRE